MLPIVAFLAVFLAVIFFKLRRTKKPPQLQRSQNNLSISPSKSIVDGLPFHGIRVVDFSTVVAGPIAARVFAELGAEVVKVEGVNGDPFRKTFREYEPGRRCGTMFEVVNLGKSSIVLDLKKASGVEQFFKLLQSADVLVTNVRVDALKRLGLDYQSLRAKLPHLVYCSLTAYGSTGPDANAPGYDVGAFWAASGMAASIQPEPLHMVYPAAFGDITSGSALVGGAACALRRRSLTGVGGLVDLSLLGVGMFAMSAVLCQAKPDPSPTVTGLASNLAVEGECSRHFACVDGAVAVLGPRLPPPPHQHSSVNPSEGAGGGGVADAPPTLASLERALGLSGSGSGGGIASVSAAFAKLTVKEALAALKGAKVPCCEASRLLRVESFLEEHKEGCLFHPSVPGFEDVPQVPRKPYVFLKGDPGGGAGGDSVWKEEAQRPTSSAPALGAHTQDVLQNGWQERHPSCVLPAAVTPPASAASTAQEQQPLHGVVVVELSWGSGVAAAATAMLLREAGATVIKVVTQSSSSSSSSSSVWERLRVQYDFGKEEVELASLMPASPSRFWGSGSPPPPLAELLAACGAHSLVTDAPPIVLEKAGVLVLPASDGSSPSSSSSSSAPQPAALAGALSGMSVAVTVVSPWGVGGEGAGPGGGDLGPFWSRSGMGATVSGEVGVGGTANVRPLPLHMGELITAIHAFAATSAALLYRERCTSAKEASSKVFGSDSGSSGSSNNLLVDVSMHRSGLWCASAIAALLTADPNKAKLWDVHPDHIPIRFPIPTMTTVHTRDGVSVQLLGLDFGKHLLPTLKALDAATPKVLAALAYTVFAKVLPAKAPTRILKLVPLIEVANSYILAGARKYTYAELMQRFAKHGVWSTIVRSPAQTAAYAQAEAAGCFRPAPPTEATSPQEGHRHRAIASPVHFSS